MISRMATVRLRHVESFRDRTGERRYYFRRGHGPRTPLPGAPGSPKFMAAYHAALAASPDASPAQRYAAGTFNALILDYFRSRGFLDQKASTQGVTRRILQRFAAEHGHRSVAGMTRAHVDQILAAKAATPGAANSLLKKLRVLMGFALDRGLRTDDPTLRMKSFREGAHHTWTEAEIAAFEARWPIGSRERTAFALHLYTGQRRADVCRMTWADIAGGRLRIKQEKTGETVSIPLHPELLRALEAWPKRHVTIIASDRGAPYTPESYGNWMADSIDRAMLAARCVLHGLRKATARRLAESGCTAHQIAAITGHKSLSEVQRYAAAASREDMADAAILSLGSRRGKH